MTLPRSSQISKHLGNVFIRQGLAGFKFDDQTIVDIQVGIVIAQQCAVFIQNLKRMLLFNAQSRLLQPMSQPILVYFLQMPVTKIDVKIKSDLSDSIT